MNVHLLYVCVAKVVFLPYILSFSKYLKKSAQAWKKKKKKENY